MNFSTHILKSYILNSGTRKAFEPIFLTSGMKFLLYTVNYVELKNRNYEYSKSN